MDSEEIQNMEKPKVFEIRMIHLNHIIDVQKMSEKLHRLKFYVYRKIYYQHVKYTDDLVILTESDDLLNCMIDDRLIKTGKNITWKLRPGKLKV